MMGVNVPGGVYSHISGIDIVRAANADGSGSYYVLEDNLRVPSGVSYMLENRKMMMRLFPELFAAPRRAGRALPRPAARDAARGGAGGRQRADRRGADAGHVQQRLLRARLPGAADGRRAGRGPGPVRATTTSSTCARRRARKRVDVIYRRVDDDFLDPQAFRPDSHAGLRRAARRLPRRQRHAGQRHRHRRRRRQVDLPLRAEDDRVLPRREADPEQRADLPVPRARRPELRAGPPGRAGGQGSARRRRLRHAGRPGGDARPRSRSSASALLANPSNYIAQPTLACRPARPSSRAASRRATSTCGPSCCRARRCRWCPAG